MSQEKNRRFSPPLVGGSSLLVIFAVLCLTVFALLSLSTVQAAGRLSEANARSVEEYYKADCEAERLLAELRTGTVPEDAAYQENMNFHQPGDTYCAYSVPLSDTRELTVTVLLLPDGSWDFLRWQVVSTVDWQPDEGLDVWDGGPMGGLALPPA